MALGAFFSAAEVIPLTFLTVEAWSFLQLGTVQESKVGKTPFPHYWAVMFLAAVGFWNFLGAGVFGFLINLPIVSYYEIGTALTANHAHAAMMGVYGMLSIGLALFCLRYIIPQKHWSDKAARISFWSLNLGLAWMVFATLFPLGILQLYHSISVSYYDARTLELHRQPRQLRTGMAADAWRHRLHRGRHSSYSSTSPLLGIRYMKNRHIHRRSRKTFSLPMSLRKQGSVEPCRVYLSSSY